MTIHFYLEYATTFGEELTLHIADGSIDNKGCGNENGASDTTAKADVYPMTTADGKTWTCIAERDQWPQALDYFFTVNRQGKCLRQEWQTITHRLEIDSATDRTYRVFCRWMDMPCDSYLYSSAFTGCVNRRNRVNLPSVNKERTVKIVVRAPQLRKGDRLLLVGQSACLGNWNAERALPMYEHNYNEWTTEIDAARLGQGKMEFKFIIADTRGGILWETGMNRTLDLPEMADGETVVYELDQAFFEICNAKLAGTLIPVFSLRTEGSFGVGDFGDLKKMIDWIAGTGQKVLQVLPINDTTLSHTWTDSYPYSVISIFALHPQYADFRQLPPLKDNAKVVEFEALRRELNGLSQIDYERMNHAKTEYLQLLFAQEGEEVMATTAFKQFLKDNEHWIAPYAQYCALREKYGCADFSRWEGHARWNEADRKALLSPGNEKYRAVAFFYYVQYVLDAQMRSAHEYAMARGVILKGDIPIGVNRNGCDVWHEPQYFNLNSQAGAPPDAFSVNGQNWGFPTYNWQRMIDDGCRWWIRRFQNMSKYFDAYRIDHVLGFFRIWAIPVTCVHGLLGQFAPSLALTREEIEGYGLEFRERQFTVPFIPRRALERLFGDRTDDVVSGYLLPTADRQIYSLRPEYDTERKIEAAFCGKEDAADIALRDALYGLVADVLFVRDDNDRNKFHPRITAQQSFAYEVLTDSEKTCFDRLYNDYYYRRNNNFWYGEAMKKLPALVQATRMLVCAEDLGMVPDCVPWVMNELRILSLELQQMPKAPGVRFGNLAANPYRSVCTLSTHDMPTLRQWWDEDGERAQDYYASQLGHSGPAPHPLPGWLAREIISNQLTCPSMLCVLSLQDWFAIDEDLRLPDANAERINIPANPRNYWRYRMHVNLEDLVKNRRFNEGVKELVKLR